MSPCGLRAGAAGWRGGLARRAGVVGWHNGLGWHGGHGPGHGRGTNRGLGAVGTAARTCLRSPRRLPDGNADSTSVGYTAPRAQEHVPNPHSRWQHDHG